MMQPARCLFITMACAVTTACVSSVHPYVNDEGARVATALLGTWTNSTSTERALVTQDGPRRYGIAYTDDQGETKRFIGRLGRIGAHQVLDLEGVWTADATSARDSAGAHLAMFLDTIGPRVRIAVLDLDTLASYLEAHPNAIAHRRTKNDVVLTARTADLAKFLSSYLRRPGVLSESASWIRRAP